MGKRKPDACSGVLIVNKHAGVTSHRIISACRKLYDTQRVGHAGTLDPIATGVLPVLIGRAAKAADYIIRHDKAYRCEMLLGITTDTEDVTGDILEMSDEIPGEEEVLAVCAGFAGKIFQTPPMYSALKVGGKKLVDIARAGGEVERTPREIEIYSIEADKLADNRYALDVCCSKGTYIRTLCADIGKKLGCGAVMAALTRTRTGRFTLDEAITVEELERMTPEERLEVLRPVESLFEELPALELDAFHSKLIRCGSDLFQEKLKADFPDGALIRLRRDGTFFALGRSAEKEGIRVIRPEKLFVLEESGIQPEE
jgi:tRNA pseudouridine55 synthase